MFNKNLLEDLSSIFTNAKNKVKQLLALKKDKQHYADCIIRNERGQILLLQRSYQDDFQPGKWCLPGGKIEEGELPEKAAERELDEETGLSNVQLTYIKDVERKDSVSLYYEGFVYSGSAQVLDNGEHYRSQWVDFDKIGEYDLLLDLGNILPTLPLTIIDTSIFQSTPVVGESLYTMWILNKTRFDKGEIEPEQYFSNIKLYKSSAALEYIKRAFDLQQISFEQFTTYFNKSSETEQSLLKHCSLCSNFELEQIV